jgi:hypothetical protein
VASKHGAMGIVRQVQLALLGRSPLLSLDHPARLPDIGSLTFALIRKPAMTQSTSLQTASVVLVGGTSLMERDLRSASTAGLQVFGALEDAKALLDAGQVQVLVLGPTVRRPHAAVQTLRQAGPLPKLILVYRDQDRDEVRRHQKAAHAADRYLPQSKVAKELAELTREVLRELTSAAASDNTTAPAVPQPEPPQLPELLPELLPEDLEVLDDGEFVEELSAQSMEELEELEELQAEELALESLEQDEEELLLEDGDVLADDLEDDATTSLLAAPAGDNATQSLDIIDIVEVLDEAPAQDNATQSLDLADIIEVLDEPTAADATESLDVADLVEELDEAEEAPVPAAAPAAAEPENATQMLDVSELLARSAATAAAASVPAPAPAPAPATHAASGGFLAEMAGLVERLQGIADSVPKLEAENTSLREQLATIQRELAETKAKLTQATEAASQLAKTTEAMRKAQGALAAAEADQASLKAQLAASQQTAQTTAAALRDLAGKLAG